MRLNFHVELTSDGKPSQCGRGLKDLSTSRSPTANSASHGEPEMLHFLSRFGLIFLLIGSELPAIDHDHAGVARFTQPADRDGIGGGVLPKRLDAFQRAVSAWKSALKNCKTRGHGA